jgi:hypothetical protein
VIRRFSRDRDGRKMGPMQINKTVASIVAGAVVAETFVGPGHRKHPDKHDPEHSTPQAVGGFAIEWQSTASSQITPLTVSLWSTRVQQIGTNMVRLSSSTSIFTASNAS